jgi:hypothetical protein
MKRLLTILTTLTLLSCGGDKVKIDNGLTVVQFDRKTSDFETIDEFGGQIFKLIQSDSYNKILDLMPDLAEYKTLVNNSSLSDGVKENTIEGLERKLKSNIKSLKMTYSRLKEQTEKSGIDWSKSQLDYIDYNHNKKEQIESADILLNFSFKGVNYKIELKDCIKIGDTWLIGNQINWKSSSNNY